MSWKILYYESIDGECAIRDFIDSRNEREQTKILSWLALLEDRGPQLPRPYADLLTDGIHELRIQLSGNQVRLLYFFCFRDFIVLTHAFAKHVQRVPQSAIRRAQRCRSDFLSRHDQGSIGNAHDADV